MRRSLLAAAVLCVAACGRRDRSTIQRDPALAPAVFALDLEPGLRLGPVRIGMSEENVRALLGAPSSQSKYEEHLAIAYRDAGIVVHLRHGKVTEIVATPRWRTRLPATLELTPELVRAMYGPGLRNLLIATAYGPMVLDYRGVEFHFWKMQGMACDERCRCVGGRCEDNPLEAIIVQPPK